MNTQVAFGRRFAAAIRVGGCMTPEQLERDIAHQLAEVDRFYTASKRYERDGYTSLAKDYRRMASQAARNAAALVAQRTPETVARMKESM